MVKKLPDNGGDAGSVPASGRSGEGNGNSLSVLAWRIPWTEEPDGSPVTVHGVVESDTT